MWIDEYTTVGVVLGVSGVLEALRSALSRGEWQRTAGAFAAAGLSIGCAGRGSEVELSANGWAGVVH